MSSSSTDSSPTGSLLDPSSALGLSACSSSSSSKRPRKSSSPHRFVSPTATLSSLMAASLQENGLVPPPSVSSTSVSTLSSVLAPMIAASTAAAPTASPLDPMALLNLAVSNMISQSNAAAVKAAAISSILALSGGNANAAAAAAAAAAAGALNHHHQQQQQQQHAHHSPLLSSLPPLASLTSLSSFPSLMGGGGAQHPLVSAFRLHSEQERLHKLLLEESVRKEEVRRRGARKRTADGIEPAGGRSIEMEGLREEMQRRLHDILNQELIEEEGEKRSERRRRGGERGEEEENEVPPTPIKEEEMEEDDNDDEEAEQSEGRRKSAFRVVKSGRRSPLIASLSPMGCSDSAAAPPPSPLSSDTIDGIRAAAEAKQRTIGPLDAADGDVEKFPLRWQGTLAMKKDEMATQWRKLHGDDSVLERILPPSNEANSVIRVVGKMRLDNDRIQELLSSMEMGGDHACLIITPAGETPEKVIANQEIFVRAFVHNLRNKSIAGISYLSSSTSGDSFIAHLFPPGEFTAHYLTPKYPDLFEVLSRKHADKYLLVLLKKKMD